MDDEERKKRRRASCARYYQKARAVDPEKFRRRNREAAQLAIERDPVGVREKKHEQYEQCRAKWREAGARYRAAHPGREAERDRKARTSKPDAHRQRKREEARLRRERDPVGERTKRHERYIKNKDYFRRWREAHPDSNHTAQAKWRKAHPDYTFVRKLRSEFGMSPKDYEKLLAKQGGVCAICKQPESSPMSSRNLKIRRLAVDHDHAREVVRGLLCYRCNTGVGLLGDDPQRLQTAKEYLEKPR
jgi:hypothetical protein